MITYGIAERTDAEKLLLVLVEINGERVKPLAEKYIACMFSSDYRKPTFVVAKKDDEIVGAAAFSEEFFTTGCWGISWVCVKESHRHQGIASNLVNICLQEIQRGMQKSKVSVILGTYPEKTKLYDNLGFEKMGQDDEGGWFMRKSLWK